MNKNKRKPEVVTIPLKQVKEFRIPKLSLPLTLDEYFSEWIVDVHKCLLFLERFTDTSPEIKRLIDAYNSVDEKYTTSLDCLAKKAEIEPSDFRRLMITTIDYLCSDDADMVIRLSQGLLVRKSLAIAMDETLPESYNERKGWLEYLGKRPVNKGQQLVSVNVAPVQNNIVQQGVVNGLPSFASTISNSEKVVSQTVKEMIQGEAKQLNKPSNVIDIKEVEKVEIDV